MEEGGGGENENRRDWADLTQVCLVNILSRVGHEDRWKGAMLVCKSWFHASRDPSLFSTFDLDRCFLSSHDTPLWWAPAFEVKIDRMLRSAVDWSDGRIEEIRVRHCSDRSLSFVAERSPNLQVLSIKSCPNVTDMSIAKIASGCCMLKELDVSYCYEISYKSLVLIGRGCPNLKVLKRNLMNWLDPSEHLGIVPSEYLNALPQDGDREASVIAEHMHNLEHLELQFSKMTPKCLAFISKGCGSLGSLDLFGCANLTSQAVEHASSELENMKTLVKPNLFIPRSNFHIERYGHWNLYDERFRTGAFFQI